MDGMKLSPRGQFIWSVVVFFLNFFFQSSLFYFPGSLLINFFSHHPWHHLLFGTPTYPSNLPTALPPTSPSTPFILLTLLLCLLSPPSPTLENQWDQGLGLQGFEFLELERNEEKEGEELLLVSRWEELSRVWRKAQLQGKLLSLFFFHYIIIIYCFAKRTWWCKNIFVSSFKIFFFLATIQCITLIGGTSSLCFVATQRGGQQHESIFMLSPFLL
jgi:hypothetical protein